MQGRVEDKTVTLSEIELLEVPTAPVKPALLGEYASEEWDRVVGEMVAAGTIQSRDMAVIAAYCQTFQEWRKVQEFLNVMEPVTTGAMGQPKANPLIELSIKLSMALKQLAGELLLTPDARGVKISDATRKSGKLKGFGAFLHSGAEEFEDGKHELKGITNGMG